MPAVALSRVGARVVESGPDGEDLAAGTWHCLEALPVAPPPGGCAGMSHLANACVFPPPASESERSGWLGSSRRHVAMRVR
jgi:hypothetical protein